MAASPNIVSTGSPMIITKDEATAAQRTWSFYLSNSADGTPATGKTLATTDFKISKAGGAFGNAVGTITEISLGWYKIVFDAGDVDTLGVLSCELSGEAGVDTLHVSHQVVAYDLNTATVSLTAGSITTASFTAGAIDAAAIGVGAIAADAFAAGAIDAAAIATGAIDADAIATDAFGALELAAGAAAEIADAVWDETLTSHTTTNTFGLALVQASSGQAGNTVVDNFTYDSYGMMTACRLRIFSSAANAEAATLGGSAETGTVAVYTIAATGANGRATLYRSSED